MAHQHMNNKISFSNPLLIETYVVSIFFTITSYDAAVNIVVHISPCTHGNFQLHIPKCQIAGLRGVYRYRKTAL